MAVVASEDGDLVMQDPLSQESGIVTGTGEDADEVEEDDTEMDDLKMDSGTSSKASSQNTQSDPKLQKEMETCFGFDEVIQHFVTFEEEYLKISTLTIT